MSPEEFYSTPSQPQEYIRSIANQTGLSWQDRLELISIRYGVTNNEAAQLLRPYLPTSGALPSVQLPTLPSTSLPRLTPSTRLPSLPAQSLPRLTPSQTLPRLTPSTRLPSLPAQTLPRVSPQTLPRVSPQMRSPLTVSPPQMRSPLTLSPPLGQQAQLPSMEQYPRPLIGLNDLIDTQRNFVKNVARSQNDTQSKIQRLVDNLGLNPEDARNVLDELAFLELRRIADNLGVSPAGDMYDFIFEIGEVLS